MDPESDILDLDWNNPDVMKFLKFYKNKTKKLLDENQQPKHEKKELKENYEELEQKSKEQDHEIEELKESKEQLEHENKELKARVKQLGSDIVIPKVKPPEQKRSYNARNFTRYPRCKTPKKKTPPLPPVETCQRIADQTNCPFCDNSLSNCTGSYKRTIHSIVDGKPVNTIYDVYRRYCTRCEKQVTPHIPGTLSKEPYDVDVISKIGFIRCVISSYEKIQNIMETLFHIHIPRSTLVRLCNLTAKKIRPIYDKIFKRMVNGPSLGGDETGWFLNGKRYWVWAFVNKLNTIFHITNTRASSVPKELLDEFNGVLLCDSYRGWNDISETIQRCLVHYYRDLHRTSEQNESAEFNLFFNKLHAIFDDAIDINSDEKDKPIKYPCSNKSKSKRLATKDELESLFYRLDEIINYSWTNKDCLRYIKRLTTEREQLFVFLQIEDIDYHNNSTERAIRSMASMRKNLFGSRSENGIFTTETLMSLHGTCKLQGINFCQFLKDALNGKIDDIPEHVPIPIAH